MRRTPGKSLAAGIQCEIHLKTLPQNVRKLTRGALALLEERCVTGLDDERIIQTETPLKRMLRRVKSSTNRLALFAADR